MNKTLNQRELSGYHLKWIALITMTLDHFGKMFAIHWAILLVGVFPNSEYTIQLCFSAVISAGRMTPYIFMWFIAEGCRHTHNIKAYIGRLLLFGLLAEIPFQLMVKIIMGEPFSIQIGFTNVMFTFALGAIACYGYQLLKDKGCKILYFAAPFACVALAYLLHTDYGYFGVLCIFLLYFVEDRKKRLGTLAVLAVLYVGIQELLLDVFAYGFDVTALPFYAIHLAYALLSVALLSAYHGERGKGGKMGKYLFYTYYPVHITVLVLLFVWLM